MRVVSFFEVKSCAYVFKPTLLRQRLGSRMVRHRLTEICNFFCFPMLSTYLIAYCGLRSSQESSLISQEVWWFQLSKRYIIFWEQGHWYTQRLHSINFHCPVYTKEAHLRVFTVVHSFCSAELLSREKSFFFLALRLYPESVLIILSFSRCKNHKDYPFMED